MQIQQLIYFVAAAEQGSLNKAAEVLFVTQPNLSKAIGNLERELNIRVFDRTNKGVVLTSEGKKLYRYSKTVLDQLELIEGLAVKEAPKVLSVASYPIITMGRLLSSFYNTHKDEQVTLKLVEQRISQVIESVETGRAEIGFIMVNEAQSKELKHTLEFKDLKMESLGTDTWYANLGPRHPLYDQDEVTIQQLLDYPFVRLPDDYFSNLTFYLEIDGVPLASFERVIYVNDSAAILSILQKTDALRFGPGLSAPDFAEHGIRTVPIHNCAVKIDVGWIQRKREILSQEARSFVSELEKLYPL